MEKIIKNCVKITQKLHKFYCDNCGLEIGISEEYEDGYFKNFGEYKEEVLINGNWYSINRTLCDKCKEKFIKNIINKLEELGFKKEC